ncbi:MAG: hypothetical protein J6R86_00040 [Lentisphaeria bacterium]|nr:hypothetical protein [Lentisphaeria bacterium]
MVHAVEGFEFNAEFSRDKWNPADFVMVKGPRWSCVRSWRQESDHIVQEVPDELTDKQLHDDMQDEAYVAMCYGQKIKMEETIVCSSTMSFDDRMAPLIVIAPELGTYEASGAPEFREHWEIVLYDLGLNVWKHMWIDDKPAWVKHSYMLAPFKPRTRYELKITITATPKGQMLEVECDDRKFGCHLPELGKEFYLGITACEGRNRFYDFKLSVPKK